MTQLENFCFDIVIVGGGSAGCVLANRLSALENRRICFVEAGPDTPPDDVPLSIYREGFLPDYFSPTRYWTDLKVFQQPIGNKSIDEIMAAGGAKRYEQARIMGGGSSVNGQVLVRGLPRDYDEWEEMGAEGWSFRECLPFFRKLESDLDFSSPLHGKDGPMPVRRTFPEHWSDYVIAFRDLLEQRGIRYIQDGHSQDCDASFPFSRNNLHDQRVSAAVAYLPERVRRRPNLTILTNAQALRVQIENGKVTGVIVRHEGVERTICTREVVLSAGALHSPAILMRSGIGPADHLSNKGVAVIADRPGVGENLRDHPMVGFGIYLTEAGRAAPRIKNNFLMHVRWSSHMKGCVAQDMKLSVSGRYNSSRLGQRMAAVNFGPNKTYSRGIVRLASPDPDVEPFVAFNYLSDERDFARIKAAVPIVAGMLASTALKPYIRSYWPGVFADSLRKLSEKSWWNDIKANTAAILLDAGGPFRSFVLTQAIDRRFQMAAVLSDDRVLGDWIRHGMKGDWHACGTCRMGRADDRLAVVNNAGRVYGVNGLRVADASVMPTIPSANINASVMMIAEKIAHSINANSDGADGRPV